MAARNMLIRLLLEESSSSSSNFDSDFDMEDNLDNLTATLLTQSIFTRRSEVPRVSNYIEIIELMTEYDFVQHFRLSRDSVRFLEEMITEDPALSSSENLNKQILITLWILATPDSFRSVADRFGVSKSVLWFAVKNICSAIGRLSRRMIMWPTLAEVTAEEQKFRRMSSFPGVIGCIDGTHIPITAPRNFPEVYVNRKGFHSIILQAVVNSNLQFIDCYVGEVGSLHDARVFRRSNLGQTLAAKVPTNYHLLGDSAYPLHPNLLTPFKDNGHLALRQNNYNYKLSKTRCTVERAFGLLKGRFRRLQKLDVHRIDLVPQIAMACCVLHNVARDASENIVRDYFEEDDDDDEQDDDVEDDLDQFQRLQRANDCISGSSKRADIMNSLIIR